jgi:hypothetical protein
MAEDIGNSINDAGIPASLQRGNKEHIISVQLRIPISWWEEVTALARGLDQDVSTFLREATEDRLQRARKVRRRKA